MKDKKLYYFYSSLRCERIYTKAFSKKQALQFIKQRLYRVIGSYDSNLKEEAIKEAFEL